MSPASGDSATVGLDQPLVEGGIASINFFNGRLLSAEDLRAEQLGQARARARLGQALGAGVATGLEVSEAEALSAPARPVLRVEPGIAITPRGTALELPTAVNVALLRERRVGLGRAALFADCEPAAAGLRVAGAGAYLLTIAAAEQARGRAETSGLREAAAACDVDRRVEGVRFRLIHLPLSHAELTDRRLRNRLAHRAFGTEEPARLAFGADPFGPPAQGYGLLDELRRDCLGEEETPLATLHWTAHGGLRFVDLWSARRRPIGGGAARWPLLLSERAQAEAEARLLQFEQEVDDLRLGRGRHFNVHASRLFHHLPPAGILPVPGRRSPLGFDPDDFFGSAPEEVPMLNVSAVPGLIHASLFEEAIEVPPAKQQGETEWARRFMLRENARAVASDASDQLVVLFVKPALLTRAAALVSVAVDPRHG